MGIFQLFKKQEFKIKNIEFVDESHLIKIPETNLKYNDIEIIISSNADESLAHIQNDYRVLMNEDFENLIKTNFIPWLKGDNYNDLDDDKIFDGLKMTYISYSYHRIIDKYSPTGKDDFFGEFTFEFVSGNEYTEYLLQASAFVLLINNGKIYGGRNFDI